MGVTRVLTGVIVGLLGHYAAAQLPPASIFGSLPAMESPAISADGDRLAFITHSGADSFIFVAEIDGMRVTSAIQVNVGMLRSVFWASDEALVFTASTLDEASPLPGASATAAPYGVDLAGEGKVTRLLRGRPDPRSNADSVAGRSRFSGAQLVGWDRQSGSVLYPKTEAPEFDRVLYSVDPKTDRQSVIDRGSRSTRQWVVDESGNPVFRVDSAQQGDVYTLLGRQGRRWEVLVEQTVAIPEMSVLGLDAADRVIVRSRPQGSAFLGLYVLDTASGAIGETLLADDATDVAEARIDPYTHRVIGAWLADGTPVWFDEEFQDHQELLEEAFPGESAELLSWSQDRQRFLVATQSGSRSPGYYLYDASEPSVSQIGAAYASLQGLQLPARRPYSYTARDGTRIPAYLTKPVGSGEPTPLVVFPHGGPASHEFGGFDWMAHFLATRGYTVLQPDFRGSSGFGRAWEAAGFGQWGVGVMQHDLSDGVAALIDEGVVDAGRVCIVGAGYGGYAALAGATFTPELYQCAAAIAPLSDLVEMLGAEPNRRGGFNPTVGYWRIAMGSGNPDGLNERLRAASPAAHAQNVEADILLLHARDDAVVPVSQSGIMERALSSAGKSVEYIELDGEDHWLSTGPTRIAVLTAVEEFLGRHLAR